MATIPRYGDRLALANTFTKLWTDWESQTIATILASHDQANSQAAIDVVDAFEDTVRPRLVDFFARLKRIGQRRYTNAQYDKVQSQIQQYLVKGKLPDGWAQPAEDRQAAQAEPVASTSASITQSTASMQPLPGSATPARAAAPASASTPAIEGAQTTSRSPRKSLGSQPRPPSPITTSTRSDPLLVSAIQPSISAIQPSSSSSRPSSSRPFSRDASPVTKDGATSPAAGGRGASSDLPEPSTFSSSSSSKKRRLEGSDSKDRRQRTNFMFNSQRSPIPRLPSSSSIPRKRTWNADADAAESHSSRKVFNPFESTGDSEPIRTSSPTQIRRYSWSEDDDAPIVAFSKEQASRHTVASFWELDRDSGVVADALTGLPTGTTGASATLGRSPTGVPDGRQPLLNRSTDGV